MEPSLVLIPSPLLGPAICEPVARALQRRGRRAEVTSLHNVAQSEPPYWPAGVDAILWPTRHIPGNHVHMFFDPDAVADAVLEMATGR